MCAYACSRGVNGASKGTIKGVINSKPGTKQAQHVGRMSLPGHKEARGSAGRRWQGTAHPHQLQPPDHDAGQHRDSIACPTPAAPLGVMYQPLAGWERSNQRASHGIDAVRVIYIYLIRLCEGIYYKYIMNH